MRQWIARFMSNVTGWLGSFPAFLLAFCLVSSWFLGGFFVTGHFGNNTYQLLINTGTTIITFLMVFVIQNTQNRDGRAVETKLDAILRILGCSDEDLIGLEDQPDEVIKKIQAKVRDEKQ